eukprot:jgi/Chrzof1/3272/Cz12g19030.t1
MTTKGPPESCLLLKNIKLLVTLNEDLGNITDAAVFVKGNVIDWVGKSAHIPAHYITPDLDALDLSNRIVLPGLVNTHHHMFQHLTRAVAPDSELFAWLKSLYGAWNAMTASDVYWSTKLAMAELILSGCTTSSDHLYCFPNDVTLYDTIRAAQEIGIRFHPTRGAMSKGESQGGMPPDSCVEDEDAILADMQHCIESYHDPERYSMCRVGLAPCSPFSVTTELMRKSAQLARRYSKVRLHTHLAENAEDIEFSQENYSCRPGGYISMVEWDRDDCWFAHCVMLNDEEMKQFADAGIGIAHCPCSNLRLASGICPVRKSLDAGVHVGLGVDGAASNDASNMISEARQALLLQRHAGNVKGLEVHEALKLAVQGGAACLGRDDIGQLAPGYAADMVAWRTDTLAFAGAQHDLMAALLLNAASLGHVDLSIINGQTVVKDGQLLTASLSTLIAETNKASARLCALIPGIKQSS